MNESADERMEMAAEGQQSSGHSGKLLLTVVIMASVFLLAMVALVLAVDPFGWNLINQLFSDANTAATAVPSEASVYIGLDLFELTPEKLGRVVDPFLVEADAEEIADLEEGLDKLDDEILSEYGFTIQDDIQPWLGRSAGFAISHLQMDQVGGLEEVDWSLIISSRNSDRADDFLERLRQVIGEESGYDFNVSDFEGVSIYELASAESLGRLAMTRYDDLVILGAGATVVQASIEAKRGESLANSEQFEKLVDELPQDSALTVYVAPATFEAMMEDLTIDVYAGSMTDLATSSSAGSLSITDDGLQVDVVTLVNGDGPRADQLASVNASSDFPSMDRLLPESTLIYVAGRRLDLSWESFKQSMTETTSQDDMDESMDLVAKEFGINPDTDLLPLLDGEWAFGIVPGTVGLLSEVLDIDMVVVMLAQTSEQEILAENLAALADSLEEQAILVEPEHAGDMNAYTLRDYPQGPAVLGFGTVRDYMFISTDVGTVKDLFAGGPSLTENDRYQRAWRSFPYDMAPAYYVDVTGLMEAVRQSMDAVDMAGFEDASRYLKPLTTLAGATKWSDDMMHSTMIVFIAAAE